MWKALRLFRGRDPSEAYNVLRQAARQAGERSAPPRIVQLETTRRCNLRCIMCPRTRSLARVAEGPARADIVAYWQTDLSPGVLASVLDQCPEAESLVLHGIGEPLLYPQLLDLIDAAARLHMDVSFFTNGALLSQCAQQLARARVSRVTVSLDGASSPVFERIRRGGSLQQVLKGVRALVQSRQSLGAAYPEVAFHVTLCRRNRREVLSILRLASELGACEVSVSPVEPADALIQLYKHFPYLLEHDMGRWRSFAERHGVAMVSAGLRQHRLTQSPRPGAPGFCIWPWMGLYVSVDGKVLPCCHLSDLRRHSLGDISVQTVTEIWNGQEFRAFRRGLLTLSPRAPECWACAYYVR